MAAELTEQVVDDDVAPLDQLLGARGFARVALPDQDLVDLLAEAGGLLHRDVSLFLVIEQMAGTVVRVHRDQHAALGIPDAVGTSLAAEAAEHLRVDHAEPRAGEHGDR